MIVVEKYINKMRKEPNPNIKKNYIVIIFN